MMAPEDTEDLISELQTNKHSEILVVAGATSSHLTVSLFSVSQCQRWIRLTTVWVHWLMSLKIWSILPTTTLRANQLPNAKQVSAGVKTETKSNFLYLLFLLVNCSDPIHSVCQYQKLWNTPMAAVVILCCCATVKIFFWLVLTECFLCELTCSWCWRRSWEEAQSGAIRRWAAGPRSKGHPYKADRARVEGRL